MKFLWRVLPYEGFQGILFLWENVHVHYFGHWVYSLPLFDYRVPETLPLYEILNEFQKGHSHMAVVVRQYNKNAEQPASNPASKSAYGRSPLICCRLSWKIYLPETSMPQNFSYDRVSFFSALFCITPLLSHYRFSKRCEDWHWWWKASTREGFEDQKTTAEVEELSQQLK